MDHNSPLTCEVKLRPFQSASFRYFVREEEFAYGHREREWVAEGKPTVRIELNVTMWIEDAVRIQRILFRSLTIDDKFIFIHAGAQAHSSFP